MWPFGVFKIVQFFLKKKKNLVKEFHPGLFKQDLSGENNIIFENIDLQKAQAHSILGIMK